MRLTAWWRALGLLVLCVFLASCWPQYDEPPDPPDGANEPVAADYVNVADGTHADLLGGRKFTDTTRGVLVGPHFLLRQQSTGVIEEISTGVAERLGLPGPVRAPKGYELVVADFADSFGIGQRVPPKGHEPGSLKGTQTDKKYEQTIIVGKTKRELYVDIAPGNLVIVAAKPDQRVLLSVTDSGRTQQLDLRNGNRAKDAISGYYPNQDWTPPAPQKLLSNTWAESGEPKGEVHDIQVTVETLDARLSPFAPTGTWSRKGRAWLYVTLHVSTTCGQEHLCRIRLSPQLTVPEHGKARRVGVSSFWTAPYEQPSRDAGFAVYAFEVPAKAKAADLRLALDGPVTTQALDDKKAKPQRVGWKYPPSALVIRTGPKR